MKKNLFLIYMFLLLLCFPSQGHAQVYLEQGKILSNVSGNETLIDKLTVHNTTDKNVVLKVYWEDFVYEPPFDGTKKFMPQGTMDGSMASWVSFSPKEIELGPYQKKEVTYSIKVPSTISKGHYGVLFFENDTGRVEEKTGLNIVTRVGCLFFIEPQNKEKKVRFENVQLNNGVLTGNLKNDGNVIVIPEGTYYIIDQDGVPIDRGTTDKVYLPAQQTAPFHVPVKKDLSAGTYTMILTLDLAEKFVSVYEIDFSANGYNLEVISIRN